MSTRAPAGGSAPELLGVFRRPRAGLATALRVAVGFVLALAFWVGFSAPYERAIAAATECVLRSFESPPVTRLEARPGEIVVRRSDFPPFAPTTGLPAAALHGNFVLLAALFALHPRPWRGERVAAFLIACAALSAVHVVALALEVQSLYATRLGAWSAAHYGRLARNLWGAGFHFYQIAGTFAAPFMLWWPFAGYAASPEPPAGGRRPRR